MKFKKDWNGLQLWFLKTCWPRSFPKVIFVFCKVWYNREFKIPRRRRPRKRHLKSEFAFFQSLSRLLQLIYFVKCKRTLFEPNSQGPHSSSRRLFASSIKREIRHFPVVVVQWRQRNVQKSRAARAEVLFCLFNLLLFWPSRCRHRRSILGNGTNLFDTKLWLRHWQVISRVP